MPHGPFITPIFAVITKIFAVMTPVLPPLLIAARGGTPPRYATVFVISV